MTVNKVSGSEFNKPVFTSMFLHNSLHVRTFMTQARFDRVIYSPAFPTCFETLPEVDHVEVSDAPGDASPRPERMTVHFKPDAFPSEQRPVPATTIRFPMYKESGHVVSMTQPMELSADVEAWLGEAIR